MPEYHDGERMYTRKEVRALLKRQIAASAESYNRVPPDQFLCRLAFSTYVDDMTKNHQRLKKVNVIKF